MPASLDDPDMRYFIGRVNGQAVSTSIGVISDGVVGIFGVATKPAYRRRGYGTAMTWARAKQRSHFTSRAWAIRGRRIAVPEDGLRRFPSIQGVAARRIPITSATP